MTTSDFPAVFLKKGRETPFVNHHPWVFAGAIAFQDKQIHDGMTVLVLDHDKRFIAYGLYNSQSQIRVRLYSWLQDETLTPDFWETRLQQAFQLRHMQDYLNRQDALRLVASEADGLSGLTIDKYRDFLVVQFTSLALYQRKDTILQTLIREFKPTGIYLRTEKDIRQEEGLVLEDSLIYGTEPDDVILIHEHDIQFHVSLKIGQKTGFYLDQRANRQLLGSLAAGRKCLDMCCYTGGFALHLAKGGATSVLAVDVSATALEIAEQNRKRNSLDNISFQKGDAFAVLDSLREQGETFDLIVLDPPKFSRGKASSHNAIQGYKRLNSVAMQLLNPRGILCTCSCSGRVSRNDFIAVLREAAVIANKQLSLLEIRGADRDHPISVFCPENEYLKCIIGSVTN